MFILFPLLSLVDGAYTKVCCKKVFEQQICTATNIIINVHSPANKQWKKKEIINSIWVIPCLIDKEFRVTSRILTKLGVFVILMVLTTHASIWS